MSEYLDPKRYLAVAQNGMIYWPRKGERSQRLYASEARLLHKHAIRFNFGV